MVAPTKPRRARGALALLALSLLPTALGPAAVALPVPLPGVPAPPIDLCALPTVIWSMNTGTTGALYGSDVKSPVGAVEGKWVLTAAPAATPPIPLGVSYVVNDYYQNNGPWKSTSALPSHWISPVHDLKTNEAASAPPGQYRWDFHFFVYCPKRAVIWDPGICYAADDRVGFLLDGSPLINTPFPSVKQYANWVCREFPFLPLSFGPHTLSALVTNDGGPTGLLVIGGVQD